MVRVTVVTASGQKLTMEMDGRSARKVRSTFGCAVEHIKEANKAFERKRIDHFEYLSRVQFAINLCSVAYTTSLNKIAKYL